MDDADERNKDKKKGGFTWVDDPLRSHLADEELDLSSLTDDEPDWYDDRYDPSAQACQTVHHGAGFWSDYVGSMEIDEPQRETYEDGLEINEDAKHDVDRLANVVEQQTKEIEQQTKEIEQQSNEINQLRKTMKEEFEIDREPIPLPKRIVNSILDDIPVAIFWFLVSAGFLLLSLLF